MYPCGFKLYASSYDINIVVQMIYRTKEICAIMLCTVISITINIVTQQNVYIMNCGSYY